MRLFDSITKTIKKTHWILFKQRLKLITSNLFYVFIAALTTIHLFMESFIAFLITNNFLKEKGIMMKDLDAHNIKIAGLTKTED